MGVCLNHEDSSGQSNLCRLITHGKVEFCQIFIDDYGVEYRRDTDIVENNPLCHAVAKGNYEICKLLINRGSLSILDNHVQCIFKTAMEKGDFEIFELIVSQGIEMCEVFDNDYKLLVPAVTGGNKMVFQYAIENMQGKSKLAEIIKNAGDSDEQYPLLRLAVEKNHLEIVEFLLLLVADESFKQSKQITNCFMEACKIGNLKMLEKLFVYEPDLEFRDTYGQTPLSLGTYDI